MTTFLLIRHGHNDYVGHTLVGRRPGVHLNDEGRREADALADRLAGIPLGALYSSPMERAMETAEPVARRTGLPIRTCEGITEIDFGDWTGRTVEDLEGEPLWKLYNTFRHGTRCPNGELIVEVQSRFVTAMERLRREHPDQVVALFSHADPIKSALCYFLGAPLDRVLNFDVRPASISVVRLAEWGPKVLRVNDTGALDLE